MFGSGRRSPWRVAGGTLLLWLAFACSTAIADPRLVVQTSHLDMELLTGETAVRRFRVLNSGDEPLEVVVDACEGLATVAADHGAAFIHHDTPLSGILASEKSNPTSIELPSFERRVYESLYRIGEAENILVLEGGTAPVFPYSQALLNLGMGHVLTVTVDAFMADLYSDTKWDLIIVNNYFWRTTEWMLQDLADHVDAGGRLLYAEQEMYRYSDHRLLASLGVGFFHTITEPLAFTPTVPHHWIFNLPHRIGEMVPTENQGYRDGQLLSAMEPAVGVASFAGYPDVAAIVVGGSGRTVCNGFQAFNYLADRDSDGVPDLIGLLENEILMLLAESDWLTVDPVAATVAPGGEIRFAITYSAQGLCTGDSSRTVAVRSNDPHRPRVEFDASLRVTGAPDIRVLRREIDLGIVFSGTTVVDTIPVENVGCSDLDIWRVESHSALLATGLQGVTVAPGEVLPVPVTIEPVSAGDLHESLVIKSNDSDERFVEVVYTGLAGDPPILSFMPDELTLSGSPGDSAAAQFHVYNSGNVPLRIDVEIGHVPAEDGGDVVAQPTVFSGPAFILERASTPYQYHRWAAMNLGLTPYVAAYESAIEEQLRSARDWAIVLISNCHLPLTSGSLDALYDYVANGGRLILADAFMGRYRDHPLFTLLGVRFYDVYYRPHDLEVIEPHDAIFNDPVEISLPTWTADQYDRNGPLVEVLDDSRVLATLKGTAGFPAIVQNPNRNVYFNTFQAANFAGDADGDGESEIISLLTNEIYSLLSPDLEIRLDPGALVVPPGGMSVVRVVTSPLPEESASFRRCVHLSTNDPNSPTGAIPLIVMVDTTAILPDPANVANDGASEALQLRNSPNPFNPQTRFLCDLPRGGHVQIRIYDLRGSLVETIDGGVRQRGPIDLAWRGINRGGIRVASATYFYRLLLDGEVLGGTNKMTVLK